MAIPPAKRRSRGRPAFDHMMVNVRLPVALVARLDALCASRYQSAALIRAILVKHIGNLSLPPSVLAEIVEMHDYLDAA